MTRAVMWALLFVVATAAAVLSFASLRDLAVLCGFHEQLAWLLPVVVDAGAGAGSLVWLGTNSPVRALRFARALTWLLLASSVGGNAVVHYLAAYSLRPTWWLVVLVSAVAPSVLGAVIHLAVLVSRDVLMSPAKSQTPTVSPIPESVGVYAPSPVEAVPVPKRTIVARESDKSSAESRARALVAENPGIGRRALALQTGVSEHVARTLLAEKAAPRNGARVLEDAK